ncbi:hypothetical protein AVEN_71220-1 [Araneus ventricosus]|uniref:Uncharacterized protein n=1 Tax=Araneus ventricosus TaxID=182803 RepID=A0A4Y2IPU8_ARAVE|nr:hypothetical protein AVEN_71220-1 [Araneus ventricosus]
MTRTTHEMAPPSPNFQATPTGRRLATAYNLVCNRPHTRRISRFRTWNPLTLRPRPYHKATAALSCLRGRRKRENSITATLSCVCVVNICFSLSQSTYVFRWLKI